MDTRSLPREWTHQANQPTKSDHSSWGRENSRQGGRAGRTKFPDSGLPPRPSDGRSERRWLRFLQSLHRVSFFPPLGFPANHATRSHEELTVEGDGDPERTSERGSRGGVGGVGEEGGRGGGRKPKRTRLVFLCVCAFTREYVGMSIDTSDRILYFFGI